MSTTMYASQRLVAHRSCHQPSKGAGRAVTPAGRVEVARPNLLALRPLKSPAARGRVETGAASDEEVISTSYSGPNPDVAESQLLSLCAVSCRGQCATTAQREEIHAKVADLEGRNSSSPSAMDAPTESDMLNGEWLLAYCSENPTRSSPFFWAFKQLCDGVQQPLPGLPSSLSDALFAITDGIPFAKTGQARHTISGVGSDGPIMLKSQVEVKLGVMDAFLPPSVGWITSTAALQPLSSTQHSVTVLTTAVKDSTWATLPGLGFVDDVTFPSNEVFTGLRNGQGTKATMETTYLSQKLRITRASDILLVHVRAA